MEVRSTCRDQRGPAVGDATWKRHFRRKLLDWFQTSARDLPWRKTADPYHVWVSEIMLQQTQVATVVAYFERFIARFPSIADLAEASEQEVLLMWEGLGYYRRARQMHLAAQRIVQQYESRMPRSRDAVLGLPGIGRYTAGAILSIAYDQREPIVEANTTRVLSRLAAYRGDPASAAGQRFLWSFAEALLPRKQVGAFNQGLMELGAEICSPRDPHCARCPVGSLCRTRQLGLQAEIPLANRKVKYEEVCQAAVVIGRRGKYLLRRCGDGERWAGLWDFPRFEVASQRDVMVRQELTRKIRTATGLSVELLPRWTTIKHAVTRFRITLLCYQSMKVAGRTANGRVTFQWVRPAQLDHYPLSVTGRKISRMLLAE